ncbi:very short patch repair endonuclease [Candidatus Woesearchaeota archaeon]|nr:very short patch repair endonuclease [Candidatus Woesearchaeota archaeon]
MTSIKSRNTKPELILKDKLKGFIFQPLGLMGKPDFINWKTKTILFVDGCFWHKCPKHYKEPKSNRSYWLPKLERNEVRAGEVNLAYKYAGWKVIRIWEHELKF